MSDKTVPEALQNCVANSTLLIGENYIFIIISIVFYYVIQHSKNLIEKTGGCNITIDKGLYDGFISSLVYWIISFVMFIFIKYNGLSTVNYFVWQKEKLNTDINLINKNNNISKKNIIFDRLKFVSQNIFSLIFSILNVIYSITLFIVLYKLIKEYIILLECEKPDCTPSKLCNNNASAVYYQKKSNDGEGKCLDKDYKEINIKKSTGGSGNTILTSYLVGENASNIYSSYTEQNFTTIFNIVLIILILFIYILVLPLTNGNSYIFGFMVILISIILLYNSYHIYSMDEDLPTLKE